MYPFSSKHGIHHLGEISAKDASDIITAFPQRYHYYRAETTHWECRLLQQNSERITLQFIDVDFERPRGRVNRRDVPYLYIRICEESTGTVLHYTYQWNLWKLFLVSLSASTLTAALIYTTIAFAQLSSRDILLYLILWGSMAALLIYWLVTNYRHDKLTIHVFKDLLSKNFPNT